MTAPIRYADAYYAGGQPTPEQLAGLAREGVRTVINLRAPSEPVDFDEAAEAGRLGLRYVPFPVAGPDGIDLQRVRDFGRVLEEARRAGGVLIHCATSNRVGAMVALDEVLNRGGPLDAALALGRSAGLASLEPRVTALAGLDGATP